MNESQTERFNAIYRKLAEGNRAEALRELRELARALDEPWSKTALLYHEALFLLEMARVTEARQSLENFKTALGSIAAPPLDGYEDDLAHNLAVMGAYTEVRVLLAEHKEERALKVLEDLLLRYPKQLSIPGFREILVQIKIYHGMLLADVDRWKEARSVLEDAFPPEVWRSVVSYYLGHCYYVFHEYERAAAKLRQALDLGLTDHWEGRAHYILGLVEYHLGNPKAAKREFELFLKTAEPEYLSTTKIWEWLEATAEALGLYNEAIEYHEQSLRRPPSSKPN